MFRRPHHQRVHALLLAMDSKFLEATGCCFGGGTCLALRLGEFRESEDMGFLCASREGYRALRGTVTNVSLGRLFISPPQLLREVRFDRYGIRTVLAVDDTPVKFEIVLEGWVHFGCEEIETLPVPVVDRVGLFAEKLLANSDRYADRSTYARDIIDLLVMIENWGGIPDEAWAKAQDAYGGGVVADFDRAVQGLRKHPAYLAECLATLDVESSVRESVRGTLHPTA